MADDRMALLDMVRKASADGDTDFLREGVRAPRRGDHGGRGDGAHRGAPGRARPRRSPDPPQRVPRPRPWDTRVGTIDLAIPRVRDGSYFPSLLDPRRRAERALLAVV